MGCTSSVPTVDDGEVLFRKRKALDCVPRMLRKRLEQTLNLPMNEPRLAPLQCGLLCIHISGLFPAEDVSGSGSSVGSASDDTLGMPIVSSRSESHGTGSGDRGLHPLAPSAGHDGSPSSSVPSAVSVPLVSEQDIPPADLITLVNDFFALLASLILEHDGDVVSFFGDVLLVAFSGEHSSQSDLLRAAVCCAHRVCALPEVFSAGRSRARIEVRAACAVDTIHGVELGGLHSSWLFGVVGDPVAPLVVAAARCEAGECALLPGAELFAAEAGLTLREEGGLLRVLPDELAGLSSTQTPRTGRPHHGPSDGAGPEGPLERVVLRYIPRDLRVRATTRGWPMFVMETALVCVALPTLQLLPDGTVSVFALHDAVCVAQRAVMPRGGDMAGVWVDGRGALLLVVFPASAALQAVRAAVNLERDMTALRLPLGVGIAYVALRLRFWQPAVVDMLFIVLLGWAVALGWTGGWLRRSASTGPMLRGLAGTVGLHVLLLSGAALQRAAELSARRCVLVDDATRRRTADSVAYVPVGGWSRGHGGDGGTPLCPTLDLSLADSVLPFPRRSAAARSYEAATVIPSRHGALLGYRPTVSGAPTPK